MPKKTIDQEIASLEEKLAAKKSEKRQRERKEDTRRKIIAGGIALSHCDHDEHFRQTFRSLIDEFVKRDGERALFADLLETDQKTEPGGTTE